MTNDNKALMLMNKLLLTPRNGDAESLGVLSGAPESVATAIGRGTTGFTFDQDGCRSVVIGGIERSNH